jgi:hypothetical protein
MAPTGKLITRLRCVDGPNGGAAFLLERVSPYAPLPSDHLLLQTDINLQSPSVCYTTMQARSWRQLDVDQFKSDLLQSLSIDQSESVDDMISTFDLTVKSLLDKHVLVKYLTRRKRASDSWYDEQCRQQKRCARKLERRYKRTRSDIDRATWLAALRSMHKLNDA